MEKIDTEILVIGGGATGTGVVRDLAMRGFKTLLVERRDLSHGTTGRYHGLLHSGGRYVVIDPLAARECISENRILRHIMPQCIEDTGGFYVLAPMDDADYADLFLRGCRQADIPVEEISIQQMLQAEPLLNPNIRRCFRVPDAAADSFLASELNVTSAQSYGASIRNYMEVKDIIRSGDRVVGVTCHDLIKDDIVEITADMVVNAAGAWAGKLAAKAGIPIQIFPGKGTMIALNHRIINTVINRCKPPSDGDIIVPIHTVAVIGTTDIQVPDPDHFAIEPWEIKLMLEEGEKIIPGLKKMRILRAWAGVRPLYQETYTSASRDISRAYVMLDHEQRDGVTGLVTITSGKWTTYRLMAEATTDLVCEILGTRRPCRTHLESFPGSKQSHYHYRGVRLVTLERDQTFNAIVCECELASRTDIVQAIVEKNAVTLDDIRREARLGMGPCQGGFCTYRSAGILHSIRQTPVEDINVAMRDFLQERWKGLLSILWGSQLRQERFNDLIYRSLLNVDKLPGPTASLLAAEMYEKPEKGNLQSDPVNIEQPGRDESFIKTQSPSNDLMQRYPEVLVVGSGLAGLIAALKLCSAGRRVNLIAKGWGATHWHTGCVDILGYHPMTSTQPLESPLAGIERLIQENPSHPYAISGIQAIEEALESLKELCRKAGYPMQGSLNRNWLLPSATGAFRPTCLAPEMMIPGDLHIREPLLIVGFEQLVDFYPQLIADNLSLLGVLCSSLILDLPSLRGRRTINSTILTNLFERPDFRAEVISAIKPKIGMSGRIGFPAVLGLNNPLGVKRELESELGLPVFEIPTLPPSIPGIRLHNILVTGIQNNGGRVYNGMQVISGEIDASRIRSVSSEAAAKLKIHRAENYLLATGGILGGGFIAFEDGRIRESVLDLPIDMIGNREDWFQEQFLDARGHPVYRAGFRINEHYQPIDGEGKPFFENLFVAGTSLAGSDFICERSFDGIALVTGHQSAKAILRIEESREQRMLQG